MYNNSYDNTTLRDYFNVLNPYEGFEDKCLYIEYIDVFEDSKCTVPIVSRMNDKSYGFIEPIMPDQVEKNYSNIPDNTNHISWLKIYTHEVKEAEFYLKPITDKGGKGECIKAVARVCPTLLDWSS